MGDPPKHKLQLNKVFNQVEGMEKGIYEMLMHLRVKSTICHRFFYNAHVSQQCIPDAPVDQATGIYNLIAFVHKSS